MTRTEIIDAIAENEQVRHNAVMSNAIILHWNADNTATITYPVMERSITVNDHTAALYYMRLVRNGLLSYRITY
jgi:hypothetical protein